MVLEKTGLSVTSVNHFNIRMPPSAFYKIYLKSLTIVHSSWFAPLVLVVFSYLLYIQTFSGTWVMDDYSVIVNNPDIKSFTNFLSNTHPGRPLREISCLIDYYLFGLEPWGYHFQNILWHALNSWLVYLLAIRLNLTNTVAWFSSLLFLVHPVHVEVVANSSHRKDSLALAFFLIAVLSYMKIFERKALTWRTLWFGGALVFWITAYYAKANVLVFPIIALAYEYALVDEDNRLFVRWKKRIVPALSISTLIGLTIWYFYISTLPSFKLIIMRAFIKTENLASFSVPVYISMILKSIAFMFSKLILPLGLSMEYIYEAPKSFYDPWVISALILLIVSCALAYRWEKTSPQHFFLLVFGVVLWLPTANIAWHFSYFAADRYMYAPSAGLCILAVLISEQSLRITKRLFVMGWLGVLLVCSIITWKQSVIWNNDMSMYSHMLKISPRSLEAMIGLADAYFVEKNYYMSTVYSDQAIERDPTDFRPYTNMGYVYSELGKHDLAIKSFKSALEKRPDNFKLYTNLGVEYERTNNFQEAEDALNKALSLSNDYVPAWFNLGVVRFRKNEKLGARTAFYEVLKREPSHVDALTNLSEVCKEIGDDVCYRDSVRRLGTIVPSAAVKPSR